MFFNIFKFNNQPGKLHLRKSLIVSKEKEKSAGWRTFECHKYENIILLSQKHFLGSRKLAGFNLIEIDAAG